MPSDELRDLLGRYSTGELSAEEQRRLFDAALDDQDLFDELVAEHDMKQLLAEPGARDRMIRALNPPRRKWTWILAPVAALSAALILFLMRPAPKPPQQVAIVAPATAPAPPEPSKYVAPAQPQPTDQPADSKAVKQKDARDQLASSETTDAVKQEAVKKLAASSPARAAPAAQSQPQSQPQSQQRLALDQAVSGPSQNNQQARAVAVNGVAPAPFGFHYSIQTKGHLILIPYADGYLAVTSSDGAILFDSKATAAGITIDVPIPDSVSAVAVAFSASASPALAKTQPERKAAASAVRTPPEGTVEGPSPVSIELKIK
jgi:hypothetical protein